MPLVETEDEGIKMLSVDDFKEMKEKDLRKIIEEMKEDSDDDNPI